MFILMTLQGHSGLAVGLECTVNVRFQLIKNVRSSRTYCFVHQSFPFSNEHYRTFAVGNTWMVALGNILVSPSHSLCFPGTGIDSSSHPTNEDVDHGIERNNMYI